MSQRDDLIVELREAQGDIDVVMDWTGDLFKRAADALEASAPVPPAPTDDERKALIGKLSNVLCNASNYPTSAMPHLLGQNMGTLIEKVTDAVFAAGFTRHPEPKCDGTPECQSANHMKTCWKFRHSVPTAESETEQ